jgi:CubicO group peptidase (beta-lactamase class C family)
MSGLQILPADLAKLGRLVLSRGLWGEIRLIDEGYFDSALRSGQRYEDNCGLLWWIMFDQSVFVIDDRQLDQLREVGVGSQWLDRAVKAKGKYAKEADLVIALEAAWGSNWTEVAAAELKARGLSLRSVWRREHGDKIIGYQAQGYLGQYLLIYPDADMVCVRMISERDGYDPATDGGDDLVALLNAAASALGDLRD